MSNTKVAGVLVTYNPDIDILFKALAAASVQLEKLYIIDNASKNIESINEVINNFDNIWFRPLNSNVGLASAQNLGINEIKKSNATHIILFDQDSVISSGFIENMLSDESLLLASGHNVGAIGPSFYDPVSMEKYPATIYKGPFINRKPIEDKPVEATYLIASGCLFRISVIEKVGLMNEQLFIDYIDVDWSLRVKHMGYGLYVSSKAQMSHTIGDARRKVMGRTISVHSPFRRYFLVRNSFYMIRQPYIPLGYKIRELVLNVARVSVALYHSEQKCKVLKSAWYGVLDGVRGKFGPLERNI